MVALPSGILFLVWDGEVRPVAWSAICSVVYFGVTVGMGVDMKPINGDKIWHSDVMLFDCFTRGISLFQLVLLLLLQMRRRPSGTD